MHKFIDNLINLSQPAVGQFEVQFNVPLTSNGLTCEKLAHVPTKGRLRWSIFKCFAHYNVTCTHKQHKFGQDNSL